MHNSQDLQIFLKLELQWSAICYFVHSDIQMLFECKFILFAVN